MLQLCRNVLPMRARVSISLAIGAASGVMCWFVLAHFNQGAADFTWALRLASSLLARTNPYDTHLEQYPLTAAFFALPFVRMTPDRAAGLFFGISSGLLAFGLSRDGYHRLLAFLAYPYWAAMLTAQWAPLIMASAFVPALLPATMAKPQVGLPVFLTHLSRRGVLACVALGVLSVAVMPKWPFLWFDQMGYYQHFTPIWVVPGPLILMALFWYRDRDARLLLISGSMPQRWFFDSLILWLIPKSRKEILGTVFLSWGAGIWRWYHAPHSFHQVGRWSVICFYLPMLAVLLSRRSKFLLGFTRKVKSA
jgi:hypothetical protein